MSTGWITAGCRIRPLHCCTFARFEPWVFHDAAWSLVGGAPFATPNRPRYVPRRIVGTAPCGALVELLEDRTLLSSQMSGVLTLTDADGLQTPTYQSGDNVQVHISDSDANTDASTAETLPVLVTSETEDTGTPFSASTPAAAVGNTGDGTVTIQKTGYDTLSEDWTLTAINSSSFLVNGSVSGQHAQASVGSDYTSDGNQVSLRIEQAGVAFTAGDIVTFTTTAGDVVGETLTLTETGPRHRSLLRQPVAE